MFDKPFALEIVTPDRVVFSGDVAAVRVPGTQGGFQVLYAHAPILSSLEVGEITVKDMAGRDRTYATGGGFAEMRDNHLAVVVESAEVQEEIDVDRARSARERAEARLRTRSEGIDILRAEAALRRALNRLRVAGTAS
jgi:F-type H+-transporting ATPase subunit epsilon